MQHHRYRADVRVEAETKEELRELLARAGEEVGEGFRGSVGGGYHHSMQYRVWDRGELDMLMLPTASALTPEARAKDTWPKWED